MKFPPEYLVCSGVENTPRGHPSEGAGHGIAERLINHAGALGIDIAAGAGSQRDLDAAPGLRRVVAGTLAHPGAVLIMEHGELQGADIRAILAADGWRNPETLPDLTLRDRYTRATRP